MTNSIRNSSQRLEHLKQLQKTKIKADKDMLDLLTDGVLGSFIGYSEFMFTVPFFVIDERDGVDVFPHSVALTLIKDVITRWNSTYYMLERCLGLKPFITEVCREFNISPTLSERQWASAKQLVWN